MKKYYLRHKYLQHKYLQYSDNVANYLNYDKYYDALYLEGKQETQYYQTIFNDEEIEKLIKEKGFNLQDWIKEEVEEW